RSPPPPGPSSARATAPPAGRHVDRPEVHADSGVVAEVQGAGIDLWADGERLGPLPVRLELVPGALRLAGCPG
ncbi:MAG: hypothetical protein RLN74_14895, partial [Ilumatobacter fluminis]